MKFSVIIPCLNAANTIGDQLNALADQKWNGSYEVIVADNGSTDGTLAVVETFRSRFQTMLIVDASKKKGAAYARNVGVKAATGDVLLFCDADDVVGAGWIDAMDRALTIHDFVAGRLHFIIPSESNSPKGSRMHQYYGLQEYNYPPFLRHAGGGNLGVKRSIHDCVGGFDESWMRLMDTDYCWRIQLAGVKLHFEPGAVVYVSTRNTLRAMIKQAWLWGRHNVLLYKRFRLFGMPELSWKVGVNKWFKLIRHIPHLRNKPEIEKWLWQIVWNLGRLEGCLRYRVLAI